MQVAQLNNRTKMQIAAQVLMLNAQKAAADQGYKQQYLSFLQQKFGLEFAQKQAEAINLMGHRDFLQKKGIWTMQHEEMVLKFQMKQAASSNELKAMANEIALRGQNIEAEYNAGRLSIEKAKAYMTGLLQEAQTNKTNMEAQWVQPRAQSEIRRNNAYSLGQQQRPELEMMKERGASGRAVMREDRADARAKFNFGGQLARDMAQNAYNYGRSQDTNRSMFNTGVVTRGVVSPQAMTPAFMQVLQQYKNILADPSAPPAMKAEAQRRMQLWNDFQVKVNSQGEPAQRNPYSVMLQDPSLSPVTGDELTQQFVGGRGPQMQGYGEAARYMQQPIYQQPTNPFEEFDLE
jgi:hypothetical protein